MHLVSIGDSCFFNLCDLAVYVFVLVLFPSLNSCIIKLTLGVMRLFTRCFVEAKSLWTTGLPLCCENKRLCTQTSRRFYKLSVKFRHLSLENVSLSMSFCHNSVLDTSACFFPPSSPISPVGVSHHHSRNLHIFTRGAEKCGGLCICNLAVMQNTLCKTIWMPGMCRSAFQGFHHVTRIPNSFA